MDIFFSKGKQEQNGNWTTVKEMLHAVFLHQRQPGFSFNRERKEAAASL